MASTVAEQTTTSHPASPGHSVEPAKGKWSAYRSGEGYSTRLGTFVVALCFVFYACHHWYYGWTAIPYFFSEYMGLAWLVGWASNPQTVRYLSTGGAAAVFLLGMAVAYYYTYCKPRSAEFLVKTDVELSKVNWPKMTPWFSPESKVWGATYVVLIVVAFFTFYVFGVDWILQLSAQYLFYR